LPLAPADREGLSALSAEGTKISWPGFGLESHAGVKLVIFGIFVE
jgi:hypothetical protein